jgi:hypothetical protein
LSRIAGAICKRRNCERESRTTNAQAYCKI